jgi:hypothetical protein
MELDKNEHSILGFFPSSTMAENAMQALKDADLVPSADHHSCQHLFAHSLVKLISFFVSLLVI